MEGRQPIQHQPLAPRSAPLPTARYPPQYSQQTPAIFQSVNLRRGKWTAEEEDYAEFVIKEFERGTLKECENGTTLRAFLSRKLHCAPMRISKKYAGKSIGKLVFLSKPNMPEATLAEVEAKRRELEVKFYKSLYEEMRDGPSPHPICMNGYVPRYVPNAPQMIVTPMPMASQAVGTAFMQQPVMLPSSGTTVAQPIQQQHQQPQQPHSMPLITTSHSLEQQNIMPTAVHSNSVGSTQPLQQHAAMSAHNASQPTAVAPAASAAHTKQLQQTYFNALSLMMANGQPMMPPTRAVANNNQSGRTPTQTAAAAAPLTLSYPAPKHTSVTHVSTTVAAAPVRQKHPPAQEAQAKSSNATASDVPDFLSGFEKVSGDDQRPPWMMAGTPLFADLPGGAVELQCSPPLTSKSFDDLHQMLGAGTDIYPKPLDLDATKSENGSPSEQGQHQGDQQQSVSQQPGVARSDATDQRQHSADIYATFAQQSALAVSQHSAYCRGDEAPTDGVQVIAPTAASLDLSASLAAMYGDQSASVVSQANLRAHSLCTQQQKPPPVPMSKEKPQTSFPGPTRNIVSGSERSSEVGSTEDGGSMHGSSMSSNNDATSNDSDSNSDDGPPPQKRARTGGDDHVHRNARESVSPVPSDRSSPRSQ